MQLGRFVHELVLMDFDPDDIVEMANLAEDYRFWFWYAESIMSITHPHYDEIGTIQDSIEFECVAIMNEAQSIIWLVTTDVNEFDLVTNLWVDAAHNLPGGKHAVSLL